jgi:hypothetical protein
MRFIALCIALVALSGCTDNPVAPSQSAPSGGSVSVLSPDPAVIGVDEQVVAISIREDCPPYGILTTGQNGGTDARPVSYVFLGPNGERITFSSSADDFPVTLHYGDWTVASDTANAAVTGYHHTVTAFSVPTTGVQIRQLRTCGPVNPPPPPVPPPVPPPPVPPIPIPPVPCEVANPPHVDEPVWEHFDRSAFVDASVWVYNKGTWKIAVYAASSGVEGFAREKSSFTTTIPCGVASKIGTPPYDWTHHPFDQWWIVVWLNGLVVKQSPVRISLLPAGILPDVP